VATPETKAKKGGASASTKTSKKPTAAKTGAKAAAKPMSRSVSKTYGPRADLGAPIDAFFAKQPASLRPVLDALRTMIETAAPKATSAIKWGMPFFSVGSEMMCAIGAHKSHVNLILSGPPGTYADPKGLLEGEGKTGRHLKLRSLDDLPRDAVRGWLKTAAARVARGA
jgi:hypothetical protein